MEPLFNRDWWAERVRHKMRNRGLTMRDVEAQAGVSKATVSRVSRANGKACPDVETYLRLNAWMMTRPTTGDKACLSPVEGLGDLEGLVEWLKLQIPRSESSGHGTSMTAQLRRWIAALQPRPSHPEDTKIRAVLEQFRKNCTGQPSKQNQEIVMQLTVKQLRDLFKES